MAFLASKPQVLGGRVVLLTLAIILFVAWLVGLALFEAAGTAIRLLIVLSMVALILRLAWGRSARADLGSGAARPAPRVGPPRGTSRVTSPVRSGTGP